jgi:hypothetical protein
LSCAQLLWNPPYLVLSPFYIIRIQSKLYLSQTPCSLTPMGLFMNYVTKQGRGVLCH